MGECSEAKLFFQVDNDTCYHPLHKIPSDGTHQTIAQYIILKKYWITQIEDHILIVCYILVLPYL